MYEFKVAEAVPLTGSISYVDLAQKVNVPMLNLRRLIRHAMTNHIFHEPQKGVVAHTRASRLLLENAPLNAWVGFMTNDLWLPIANVVNAMKKWPGSGESTETSVNLAYNQDLPWFDFLQQDKVLAKRYSLAMEAHGGGEGFAVKHTVEGYPWGDLGDATVVDVSAHPVILLRIFRGQSHLTNTRWVVTKVTFLWPSPRNTQSLNSSFKTQQECAHRKPSLPFRNP